MLHLLQSITGRLGSIGLRSVCGWSKKPKETLGPCFSGVFLGPGKNSKISMSFHEEFHESQKKINAFEEFILLTVRN